MHEKKEIEVNLVEELKQNWMLLMPQSVVVSVVATTTKQEKEEIVVKLARRNGTATYNN